MNLLIKTKIGMYTMKSIKTILSDFCLVISCMCIFITCTQDAMDVEKSIKSNITSKAGEIDYTEVVLTNAGTLETLLGNQKSTLENLKLKGPFNALDAKCMREMSVLKNLDMKEVQIIGGEDVYYGNHKLEDNKIGDLMFSSLKTLISVILPSNVTEIGSSAFSSSGIKNVELPANLQSIEPYAFSSADNLQSIIIPDGVTIIGEGAFFSCKNIVSVHLPLKLKRIETRMFHAANKLETVNIPDGVESIGDWAFRNTSLKSAIIPSSVTTIGEYAFQDTKVQSVVIPNTVKSIGRGIFGYCTELVSCTLPENLNSIPEYMFLKCSKLVSYNIPPNIEIIGPGAFQETQLSSIVISENVKIIGNSAFEDCSSLSSVSLSEGLTEIGGNAFNDCISLEIIEIPKSVRKMGGYVFSNCTSLKTVKLSDGLVSLEPYVFYGCENLQSITIPSTVTYINSEAIGSGVDNLTSVFWNTSYNCERSSVPKNCLIYVATNATMPAGLNVIVKGEAESISLVEGIPFNCPQEFFTKKITFKKNFSMKTGNGEAAGWETIILPFTPTIIKDKDGTVLAPFGSDVKNAKYFWLRELTANGFKNATKIEANKPYIIAMPNHSDYEAQYIITGDITFEAQNVTIGATPSDLSVLQGPEFSMTPVYRTQSKANFAYAINKGAELGYKPGSAFISGIRDLLPFEAYVTPNRSSNSLRAIRIDGPARTKSSGNVPLKDRM